MDEQLIIAGFGGQGVQLIGQILAKAAIKEGSNVSVLPSYGPETRGGMTNCAVVISTEPVASPIVAEPTCAMTLDMPSFMKFENAVVPGGALIINTSLCAREVTRTDITIIRVPANEIASRLGNDRVANMVMLGAYLAYASPVQKETVMTCLKEAFGPKREHLLPINERAMDEGAACLS